jgi:2-polyprenyl-3-methyl-5-hydroxy-6-metoxy-1,4-benzoquinol methylase
MASDHRYSSGYAERVYSRYSEVRPGRTAPGRASDLLALGEPVFRKLYLSHVPANKDARILDIGCGYGEFLYFLQTRGYRSTKGIDLNQGELDLAQALGVKNLERADSFDFLHQSGQEFDFISAIDVLEHVPKNKVLEFLDLIHASLRPRATFLCQVPNAAAFCLSYTYGDFSHETPFTASSLRQVLELANFVDIEVFPGGPVVHGVKSAVRFVLWKVIVAGMKIVQIVEGGGTDPLSSIFTGAMFAVAKRGD